MLPMKYVENELKWSVSKELIKQLQFQIDLAISVSQDFEKFQNFRESQDCHGGQTMCQ